MRQRTFRLDKLVRDNIVTDIEAEGGNVELRELNAAEGLQGIAEKVMEELKEALVSPNPAEQLAEAQQALDDLSYRLEVTTAEKEAFLASRLSQLGGFGMGYFVETVTLPEDSQLAAEYAADPIRYPEVKDD